MNRIRIEKVTLNIGAGTNQSKLDKGLKLLQTITNAKPVKTFTNKRIPNWGIRPGLPIGCKVTLRKKRSLEVLKNLLQAKDNLLQERQFDKFGNLAFGLHEYIDIPGVKYDPDIGILGFEVCVTFEKAGYRVKRRKVRVSKLGAKQKMTKQEAIEFLKKEFGARIE